ncbi:MAG: hypothetical protein A3I05_03375 [Deltaproteobacteria bacterium RIFCSPLOWO2_02_FULL_44_10]|nr:MAG: hypothetical protein A3C46_02950 [Deltaproteobacteria bacterium RIFCSPHIGHO2_02_FULL_44_16]OGQ46214.1 MAG: hypothetical protein A3I05_03375 [Deltaproteobacteria bacterium RIFCSPLOWO2_02_FULL_44_10]
MLLGFLIPTHVGAKGISCFRLFSSFCFYLTIQPLRHHAFFFFSGMFSAPVNSVGNLAKGVAW